MTTDVTPGLDSRHDTIPITAANSRDAVMLDPVTGEPIDEKELAEQLLAQARAQGVSLVDPGGLLSSLTKHVVETALEAELTEHLGHEHGEPSAGSNVRNGLSLSAQKPRPPSYRWESRRRRRCRRSQVRMTSI